MRNSIILSLFVVGLASSGAFASGGSPQTRGGSSSSKSPKQIADKKYNNGLKHLQKAKKLAAELEGESDAKKQAKLEKNMGKSYKKAIKDFETAIRNDPKHHQACSSLGYALRKTGNHQDSLVAYEQALSIDPRYSPAIEYRAEAHLALDQIDDVKRAYLTLFSRDRKYADELQVAIDSWLVANQDGTGELDVAQVAEFGAWFAKRKEIAARTAGGDTASGSW